MGFMVNNTNWFHQEYVKDAVDPKMQKRKQKEISQNQRWSTERVQQTWRILIFILAFENTTHTAGYTNCRLYILYQTVQFRETKDNFRQQRFLKRNTNSRE